MTGTRSLSRRSIAVVLTAALAAASAAVSPGVALAHGATAAHDWRAYVLGPRDRDVRPARVVAVAGDVRNPRALAGGRGSTTLTRAADGPAPVVVVDYGVDVGGIPYFAVAAVSGTPTLRASFSESRRFIDADGDNNGEGPCCGIAPPGAEPRRWNEFTPTRPGILRTEYQQGGQRYERITLTTPGTLTLTGLGIDYKPFLGTPDRYEGWFLSSDDTLNRIWYAGAHTIQLNMVPPGTQAGNTLPGLIDGAKRDRAIWSGDLVHQTPTLWNAFGRNGDEYVRDSLRRFAASQAPNGALAGHVRVGPDDPTPLFALFFSATYSMHAANGFVDYFRYTGDRAFAEETLPVVRRQLDWIRSLTDERGLLVTGPGQGGTPGPPLCCGLDWDPYDGQKTGAVSAYNMIFYHTIREAAWLERHLGNPAEARRLEVDAAALRRAINRHLFNPSTGLYDISDTRRGQIAQDANSLAVLWGVAPRSRRADILDRLRRSLWIPVGVRPFSADSGYQVDILSPFATGFETAARLSERNTLDALALFRRHWGRMVDRRSPDYVGAIWEQMNPAGIPVIPPGFGNHPDGVSLAHGWSTGPTWQMSQYVLGVSPIRPGYRTWVVAPRLGDLRWARGRVPTRFGPLRVDWWQDGRGTLRGRVAAPAGTRGTLVLPITAGGRAYVDGRRVDARSPILISGGGAHSVTVIHHPHRDPGRS